ncbi:hypothetical protein C2R22_13760 [Salinigranum rubrum]|uniref:Right handed beta helix domain-containing protein n=1 Tax=Salinigranum rubrum TaxID=755307 RepID=A0A2I8VKW0_9EURY|nr:right-handed parallel beta-helix repeat-containing protein [Salinigranum rubrum]AUV82572.1 hypothetical protein C2R22_13760 [Salinigranum rubrum]
MVSVTDYGATPNDGSDCTQAFRDAFDAAGDNGTVTVPEGTFTVSATSGESYSVLQITPGRLGISLIGAGPDKTRIRLTGGHTHNQVFCKHEEDYNHDGAVYRDLTLDGNGANQNDDPGFGVLLQSQGDNDMLFENVRFEDWTTNGLTMLGGGWTARDCSFVDNGVGADKVAKRDGHGIAVNEGAGSNVLIERCYFTGMTGTSVDVQDTHAGLVTMRKCVVDGTEYGAKLNPGSGEFHIDNCLFKNIPNQGIYYIPSGDYVGTLRITQSRFENIGWPAIDMPSPCTYKGGDIVIENCNSGDYRNGAWYDRNSASVDLTRIAVHDTKYGGAVQFESGASGSIDELIHSNNSGGIGDLSGVSVSTTTKSGSISVSTPTASDVGVYAVDSSDGSSGDGSGSSYKSADQYGAYQTPKAGQLDWHIPLNENFDSIGTEVRELAKRIEELE